MTRRMLTRIAAGALLGSAAMPALAVTCYELIDRTDTVVFRDARPPVDMSAAGVPAREAMRQRGELLVIFDVDNCVIVGRSTVSGSRKFTVDEIVAEYRGTYGSSGYGRWSSSYTGSPAAAPAQSAPQSAPPKAAATSRTY
jgi:hypothetical protein